MRVAASSDKHAPTTQVHSGIQRYSRELDYGMQYCVGGCTNSSAGDTRQGVLAGACVHGNVFQYGPPGAGHDPVVHCHVECAQGNKALTGQVILYMQPAKLKRPEHLLCSYSAALLQARRPKKLQTPW